MLGRVWRKRPPEIEADSFGVSEGVVLDSTGDRGVGAHQRACAGTTRVDLLGTPERSWAELVAEFDALSVAQVNTLGHNVPRPREAPEEPILHTVPRLRIWRTKHFGTHWAWEVVGSDGEPADSGFTHSWTAARALGLASLEVHLGVREPVGDAR